MIKDIFGAETRGRKKRVVTEQMIADIFTMSKEDYCEKHKVGEMFFLNLYYKNVGAKAEKEEENSVDDVAMLDIFEGVLVDTHILYEKGLPDYMKHISKQQSYTDSIQVDILHNIQLKQHSQVEKIVLFDMLKNIREKNAKYDDSFKFANDNRHKIVDFLNLRKAIEERRTFMKERVFTVRVLTKEFGEVIKGEN